MRPSAWPLVLDLARDSVSPTRVHVEHSWMSVVYMACLVDEVPDATPGTVRLNDIIWRSLCRAKIPASKEPLGSLGFTRSDGKRPDGVTLIPWSHGKCLTWDVTVPNTMATSHVYVDATSTMAGAAADRAAANKKTKYAAFQQTHIFVPVSVETLGSWNCGFRI